MRLLGGQGTSSHRPPLRAAPHQQSISAALGSDGGRGGGGAGAGVTRLHSCTVFNLEKPPTNAFLKVITIATSRNAKWEMVDVDTHQLLTLQPCVPILHLLTMFKMPVSS